MENNINTWLTLQRRKRKLSRLYSQKTKLEYSELEIIYNYLVHAIDNLVESEDYDSQYATSLKKALKDVIEKTHIAIYAKNIIEESSSDLARYLGVKEKKTQIRNENYHHLKVSIDE